MALHAFRKPVLGLAAAVLIAGLSACGNAAAPVVDTTPATMAPAGGAPSQASTPKQSASTGSTKASNNEASTTTLGGQKIFYLPGVKLPEATEVTMNMSTPQGGNIILKVADGQAYRTELLQRIQGAGYQIVSSVGTTHVVAKSEQWFTQAIFNGSTVTLQFGQGAPDADAEASPSAGKSAASAAPKASGMRDLTDGIVTNADANIQYAPRNFPYPAGGKLRNLKQSPSGSSYLVTGYTLDELVHFYRTLLPNRRFEIISESNQPDNWTIVFTDGDYESTGASSPDGILFEHKKKN